MSMSYCHHSVPPPMQKLPSAVPLKLLVTKANKQCNFISVSKCINSCTTTDVGVQLLRRSKVMLQYTIPPKQTGASFIVSLQQANGSWLLNDQLAGVVSKSVEELKSCCPCSLL